MLEYTIPLINMILVFFIYMYIAYFQRYMEIYIFNRNELLVQKKIVGLSFPLALNSFGLKHYSAFSAATAMKH